MMMWVLLLRIWGTKKVYRSLDLGSNELKFQMHKNCLKNKVTSAYSLLKGIEKRSNSRPWCSKKDFCGYVDADYPWGDPPHAIGKPDVRYQRVTVRKGPTDRKHGSLLRKLGGPRGWSGEMLLKRRMDGSSDDWEESDTYCKSIGAHLPSREEWRSMFGIWVVCY